MSLSKEQLTAAATEQPRQPKCTRCRHHGIIVPQKGHIKFCPFANCDCWKCYLITQRTRLTALQRNLNKAQSKPQKKEQRPGASSAKPATEKTSEVSSAALTGGGRPSTQESAAAAATAAARSFHDVRSRPTAGGERVAGLDSREVLPFDSKVAEEGPYAPYFGELGQSAPLPVVHFIHYPSSYASYGNFLFSMPWSPPMPAGYNDSLHGPLTFPHFQQAALHCPPEPGPPAVSDLRQVFFTLQPPTLPEPLHEELMSRQPPQPPQPPLPKHKKQNMEELQ
eukprot:superscaffoldBa00001711_g11718